MPQFACGKISRDMHAPDYSTISACLLLIERKRPHTLVTDSSFDTCLVAMTKSLAFSLGLHLDYGTCNMSVEEKSRPRHLWWLVYVQDIWVCITHGQPPIIKSDDFDVPPLSYNIVLYRKLTYSMNDSSETMETSVLFSHLLERTQLISNTHQSLLLRR